MTDPIQRLPANSEVERGPGPPGARLEDRLMDLARAALGYAEHGFPVFPCQAKGKKPTTPQGFKSATTDADQIEHWWSETPDANIGLALPDGLIVVDVDSPEAMDYLRAEDLELPATLTISTGRGSHYYYQANGSQIRQTASEIAAGIDTRVGGRGYVIVPPSIHPSGAVYRVTAGAFNFGQISSAPAWLSERLAEPSRPPVDIETAPGGFPEGQRDVGLFRVACKLRREGVPREEAERLVLASAANCEPPFPEIEALAKVESAYSRYWPGNHSSHPRSSNEDGSEPQEGERSDLAQRSKTESQRQFRFTDTGNALRLLDLFGDQIRFCPPWSKWLEWTGTHWRIDERRAVEHYWDRTVQSIYEEAARTREPEAREALAKHALRCESAAKGRAAIEVAGRQPTAVVVPHDLDQDPWLLNVTNGTLDLRHGHLREHLKNDLITKLAPASYDPEAPCPTWLRFLHRVMDGDPAVIAYLQRAVGYSLTGETSEHVLHIPYGSGANGKTTFSETVRGLLGDYATVTPAETLLLQRYDGIPNDLAALKGARLVMAAESEQGRTLAESKVKAMTGGDTISARFMRAEWFQFKPQFKIWLSTNHKPIIKGTDHAIWRRIRLIPFNVTIPEGEQDPELVQKLQAEWSGILAWAVEGCTMWRDQGLDPPAAVLAATESYQTEMDILGDFFADRCTIEPQGEATAKELYEAYKSWCEESGERPRSQKVFGLALRERGFDKERRKKGVTWRGLRVNR